MSLSCFFFKLVVTVEDGVREPGRADRLLYVCLRHVRVDEPRSGRLLGVKVARADMVQGGTREPSVHGGGAFIGGLTVRGDAGKHGNGESEDPGDREPVRASQTRALPPRGNGCGQDSALAIFHGRTTCPYCETPAEGRSWRGGGPLE
jgi:hypothetical protein